MPKVQKSLLTSEKLKQKRVLKETHHEDRGLIYPIFVTLKKDGSYRLILNLKGLNQYLEYNRFKTHDLQEILKLVTPLGKMTSLDIKYAYYSIAADEKFSKIFKTLLERQTLSLLCFTKRFITMPTLVYKAFKAHTFRNKKKLLIAYQPT